MLDPSWGQQSYINSRCWAQHLNISFEMVPPSRSDKVFFYKIVKDDGCPTSRMSGYKHEFSQAACVPPFCYAWKTQKNRFERWQFPMVMAATLCERFTDLKVHLWDTWRQLGSKELHNIYRSICICKYIYIYMNKYMYIYILSNNRIYLYLQKQQSRQNKLIKSINLDTGNLQNKDKQ